MVSVRTVQKNGTDHTSKKVRVMMQQFQWYPGHMTKAKRAMQDFCCQYDARAVRHDQIGTVDDGKRLGVLHTHLHDFGIGCVDHLRLALLRKIGLAARDRFLHGDIVEENTADIDFFRYRGHGSHFRLRGRKAPFCDNHSSDPLLMSIIHAFAQKCKMPQRKSQFAIMVTASALALRRSFK